MLVQSIRLLIVDPTQELCVNGTFTEVSLFK